VPEVEMPHLKANSFNWESLRVVGRVSAIHCRSEEGRKWRWMVVRRVCRSGYPLELKWSVAEEFGAGPSGVHPSSNRKAR
jgi:hypothetical protein